MVLGALISGSTARHPSWWRRAGGSLRPFLQRISRCAPVAANPIEAQFGPLRTFVIAGSNHPNHPVLARKLHAHLRWRNANARHPDVLAAQRRERARIRSERQHRWGQTPARAAA